MANGLRILLDGLRQVFAGLANTAHLTEFAFRAIERLAVLSYLQAVRDGENEDVALEMVTPLLRDIVSASDGYDFMVGPDVEELLQLAEEKGERFKGQPRPRPSLWWRFRRGLADYFRTVGLSMLAWTIGMLALAPLAHDREQFGFFGAALLGTVIVGWIASDLWKRRGDLIVVWRLLSSRAFRRLRIGEVLLRYGFAAWASTYLTQAAAMMESAEPHIYLAEAYERMGKPSDQIRKELFMALGAIAGKPAV